MLNPLSNYVAKPSWNYIVFILSWEVYSHVYGYAVQYLYPLCFSFDRDDFNILFGNVILMAGPSGRAV